METALLLREDGSTMPVLFDPHNSYDTLNDAMGGATIDSGRVNLYREKRGTVSVPELVGQIDWYSDDESRLKDLPINPVATALWVATNGVFASHICGPVLFVRHDDEGGTIGITEDDERAIDQVIRSHYSLEPRFFLEKPDGTYEEQPGMTSATAPITRTTTVSSRPIEPGDHRLIPGDVGIVIEST